MRLFLGVFLCFSSLLFSEEFLMKDHQEIAIATDLEPDDVLALSIIFKEANALYQETGKYPIDLIIVGEGNGAIKRKRMEAYLNYFHLPEGIKIPVVEGKSSQDNIFTHDGEELALEPIPYKEHDGQQAIEHLSAFLQKATHPLLIQIKPAPELLQIAPELLAKTTVLFYGSFNLRKTAQKELQGLLDQFTSHFKKIGIIESYSLFGKQSAVYKEYPWTDPIRQAIESSSDEFMVLFRKLIKNWNMYILHAELTKIKAILEKTPHMASERALINQLIVQWDEALFLKVYASILAKTGEHDLVRMLQFACQLKPSSGVQFTLSDIAVALALGDKNHLFTSNPVDLAVNAKGYIETVPNPASNVFYYQPVDKQKFVQALLFYLP